MEEEAAAPVGPPPGESNNEVLASGGFNYTIGLLGMGLVSAAGCAALIFGAYATRSIEEGDIDHLQAVLEENDSVMHAPVENPAFLDIQRPL